MNAERALRQPRIASMYVSTRQSLGSRTGRRILKNVMALSTAQATTYILPLFVLPYTAAVLGPKYFGMVAFTQALVQYSALVTNYGFAYAATRQAAVSQGDTGKLAEIIVHVWTAKFLLMLVCLVASAAAFTAVPSLRPARGAYLCGFLGVIGNILYLDWFFQAIEEMKWITLINVVPKLLFTPLIFVFVRAPADYALVLLIPSAALTVSGIAGAVLVRRRLSVPIPAPTLRGVSDQLREGWHTFLATLSINLYTVTNIVVLGIMTNATVVGQYSAGQKVVLGAQSLWSPVSQSLYPHFCRSFHASPGRAARLLRRLVVPIFGISLAGAIVICLAAPHFVPFYLGPRYSSSVGVIQILIFSVCATSTSNILGVHGMLAAGLYSDVLRVVSSVAGISLLMAPLSILWGGKSGLATLGLCIEVVVCLCYYWRLRRRSIL